MKSVLLAFFLLFAGGGQTQVPKSKPCTREEAIRAEAEASSLQSWAEVFKSYESYIQCDDASIGEGYSNSVAHLLSDDWAKIAELNRLVLHDKKFEGFVLHHIDELMSPTQLQKIRENASSHCPSNAKSLCKSIETKVREVTAPARP